VGPRRRSRRCHDGYVVVVALGKPGDGGLNNRRRSPPLRAFECWGRFRPTFGDMVVLCVFKHQPPALAPVPCSWYQAVAPKVTALESLTYSKT